MLKKILLACMCFPLLAFADLGPIEHHGHSLEAKGKKILYHLWRDFKNANAKSISKYTSPQFQSIHANGALNKKQELELVRNLHYTSFALSQIKITEMKGTMVISYTPQSMRLSIINLFPLRNHDSLFLRKQIKSGNGLLTRTRQSNRGRRSVYRFRSKSEHFGRVKACFLGTIKDRSIF